MAKQFETKNGKVPFPRSINDWMQNGLSEAQADHKMAQDVFGQNYKIDANGYPIETGRGSAANPVSESLKAQELEKSAAEQAKMRLGWHRGLEHAYDPQDRLAVAPEYETFISDYRRYLLDDVEVLVDMLDDALTRVYETGSDDPVAIANWDAFLELLRSNVSFKDKLTSYDNILKSGFLKPN